MLIIGMEQNLCTEKEIHEFDKLPFKNKIFFSSKNLPEVKSNCFVAEFEEKGEKVILIRWGMCCIVI